MANSLEQLKKFTIVVADTGDFDEIAKYEPQDSTTNPSLLYTAAQMKQYQALVDDAIAFAKDKHDPDGEKSSLVEAACDRLAVNFGIEILKRVPGRVSTEIDARLSFDTEGTVKKGKELMAMYEERGIGRDRVLLKIASTWEGLQAAKILESEGYHCNLTLLFALVQAHVAGEVNATLISPFAGRITDFFKTKDGRKDNYPVDEDPGVVSVREIYNHMKGNNFKTVVMGASFRTADQVIALAGCDLLTVSPGLLEELKGRHDEVHQILSAKTVEEASKKRKHDSATLSADKPVDQKTFNWLMCEDEMATIKLTEGIRRFAADLRKLEQVLEKKL